MSLKVAVQMDPLEAIKIEGDTTFLMMLTAQVRGHSLFVYTPDRLVLEGGKVFARGRKLLVPPQLEPVAIRLTKTALRHGTADTDVNAIL